MATTLIKDDPSDTSTQGKNKNLGKNLQIAPYVDMNISLIERDDSQNGWIVTYT